MVCSVIDSTKDLDYIDIHSHHFATKSWVIFNLDCRDFAVLQPAAPAFSAGIHPWFIKNLDLDAAFAKLERIAAHPNLTAIGECGLDRCIDTPLPLQVEIFQRQIELAERLGKPLIIHCVRAFGDLLQLKKRLKPQPSWIIHGFRGKPTLAEQLLNHDCHLSFGKALLHDGPTRLSLSTTPLERLFLETDDACDVSISEIYAAAAKILALDIPTLQRQIVANYNRVFA